MTSTILRKHKAMNFIAKIAFTLSATAGLMATPALSQQQPKVKGSGWIKTCNEVDNSKVCNVQFNVVAGNNQVVTAVNLIEVTGEVKRSVFRVIVPTGRSLPAGIQVQVDGKRAVTIPYAYCRPQICAAEAALNAELVKIFKAGGGLEITSLNFQSKPNAVPVTLKGFTAAYDGPPVKQEDPASREELLKKQLEEKLKQQQNAN